MPKAEPALLLTVAQAMERLAVSRTTLYRMIADGSVQAVKLPPTGTGGAGKRGATRIVAASVEALITKGRAAARKQWRS